ncbi:MAG: DUF1385 domain-containing protein [Acidimicrobiia bacterium]|nr:DUF1385 domain-containing protein [Acidimicrobiia bacterium]
MKHHNSSLKLLLLSSVRAMGGQAVINGVMMRGEEKYAVAVRRMDDSIDIKDFDVPTFAKKFQKVFFVRGIMGLGEAMGLGYRALMHSANISMKDEEAKLTLEEKKKVANSNLHSTSSEAVEFHSDSNPQLSSTSEVSTLAKDKVEDKPLSKWVVGVSVLFSIAFFVAFFKVGPLLFANLLKNMFHLTKWSQIAIESVFRLVIFIGYLYLVSLSKDIKNVFQYHGAEHKAIAAYENDVVLTPQAAQQFKTAHVRCGTNFLLIVMVMSAFFYVGLSVVIPNMNFLTLVLSRVFAIPIIAGISYEVLKAASFKMRNRFTRALVWPGLTLQKVTTRAPSDAQCEVAIASLNAVFTPDQIEEVNSRSKIKAELSWQILKEITL